jgi:hypothetical protein
MVFDHARACFPEVQLPLERGYDESPVAPVA